MTNGQELDRVANRWNEQTERFFGKKRGVAWWEAGPEIQRYINRRITGDPRIGWIKHTLQKYFAERTPPTRCLSLGCGAGGLERSIARLGGFQYYDAYDIPAVTIYYLLQPYDKAKSVNKNCQSLE